MAKASSGTKLRAILQRLSRDGYRIRPRNEGDPVLERLLALVMQGDSAYSTAEKAVKALKVRFANWSEARVARHFEVVDALRAKRIGDPETRAFRAQELLRRVFGLQNHLDLDWMDDCSSERRERTLVALATLPARVGPVLDLDVAPEGSIPVSLEHKRLFSRLGLVPQNPKDSVVQALLAEIAAAGEQRYANDLALRVHARRVCESKNPHCRQCPILDLCAFGKRQLGPKSYRDALEGLGLSGKKKVRKKTRKTGTRKATPSRKKTSARARPRKTTKKSTSKRAPKKASKKPSKPGSKKLLS